MPLELAIVNEGREARREGTRLDYLPFGVKTLKVQVRGEHSGKPGKNLPPD